MNQEKKSWFWKYYLFLNLVLVLSISLLIYTYYKVTEFKKWDKQNNNPTKIEQTIDESFVNLEWSENKDVIFVYSKKDEQIKDSFNEIMNIPLTMLWVEKSDIWYMNENYKNFNSISEKIWVIKWTPVLAIKKEKVNDVLNSLFEKEKETFTNEEIKTVFKEQFDSNFIEENWYKILRIWDYSIWWKNECFENDWKTSTQCSKITFVYDQRCNKKECSKENINILKWVTWKKSFYEEVELKSEKAKEIISLLDSNNIKERNLPFFIVNKKDFEKEQDRLYKIASSSNELTKINNDVYYLVPDFIKNDWKEWNKICTLNEELVKNNSNEYVSCSKNECKNLFECIKEEKNTADIFIMWYCPFCKDHVKNLKELRKQLKDTKFNIRYLTSFDTNKKIEELKIEDFNALHWKDEVNENVRQICINEEYWEEKLFEYFENRFNESFDPNNVESNLKDVLKKLNINQEKLETCKTKNIIIEKLVNDLHDAQNFWINSTPSWLINKKHIEQIQTNEIKNKICSYNVWINWCQ